MRDQNGAPIYPVLVRVWVQAEDEEKAAEIVYEAIKKITGQPPVQSVDVIKVEYA